MLTRRALLTTGLGLAFATTRAMAHHSTALYDMANPVTVKGSVKRWRFRYKSTANASGMPTGKLQTRSNSSVETCESSQDDHDDHEWKCRIPAIRVALQ